MLQSSIFLVAAPRLGPASKLSVMAKLSTGLWRETRDLIRSASPPLSLSLVATSNMYVAISAFQFHSLWALGMPNETKGPFHFASRPQWWAMTGNAAIGGGRMRSRSERGHGGMERGGREPGGLNHSRSSLARPGSARP